MSAPARERHVNVGNARLFVRELGSGPPLLVLHGGPDFDHAYLLPELDRLAETARLIYYDQRGRGRSAEGVRPWDVTLGSEMADIDAVRNDLGLETLALLGHSWGGLLAMEYATRHPERITHLVLMSTAPASHADWTSLRERLRAMRGPSDLERMREIAAGDAFRTGDIEAEAEYYRIHFRPTVRDPALLASIVGRLRMHFDPSGVVLARAIERRLYADTGDDPGYDLLPLLAKSDVATLLLHGQHDFIPVDLVAPVAEAMPGATLRELDGLGHFAFAERPDVVISEIEAFLRR